MKSFLALLILICSTLYSFSQDVFFDWAKQLDRRTGLSISEGHFIGVDFNKNVYLVGVWRNNIDLDPGPAEFNLSSTDWDQMYVVKLDPSGNFIWGKNIGGNRFINYRNVLITGNGDIYITGSFSGNVDFDPNAGIYQLTAQPITGFENYDLYTMKLDTDGNFKWAAKAGNTEFDIGMALALDAAGNVYTTGTFINSTDFDPGPGTMILGNNASINTFITKFDSQGNFIWAKELKGNSNCQGYQVKIDNLGCIYIAGQFDGTVDFDPGNGIYNITTTYNSNTPYIAKLDASGAFLWAKKNIGGKEIVINSQRQIISISGQAAFFAVLSKYDTDGNQLWAMNTGGRPSTWPGFGPSIQLDAADNIFLTGEFNYTTDFDPGPGLYNMTAWGGAYNYDAFICRLDGEGNFVWAKQFGAYPEEHPSGIALDTSGNIYTTGIFNGTVDFDPGSGVFNMSAYTGGGVFIHKMSRCQNVSYSSLSINTCTSYTLNNQLYTQTGTYIQTIPNTFGCDSIITLNLIVQNNTNDISNTACDSYNWDGQIYNTSGVYTRTYTSVAGCDSVVRLNLTVRQSAQSTITKTICEGQQFEGYTTSGIYTDRFMAASGCDSIRTLNLTVTNKVYATVSKEICQGETFLGYTTSGNFIDHFTSSQGCDSIRTLNLTVHPAYNFTVNKTICKGETYMGHTISGRYTDRMQTITGCDSIQTTILNVLEMPKPFLGKDTTLCLNDSIVLHAGAASSYNWQDGSAREYFVVKAPGRYTVDASNICGSVSSSILIETNSCIPYFPNAFTPNRDGKNDEFGILNAYNIKNYRLSIYNRWGELIFESRNPSVKWNGTSRGMKLDSGAFIWQCSFTDGNNERHLKGTVMLIQ